MTAYTRLTTGYYNADVYDASTNPGGFSGDGHRINLFALADDLAEVAELTNDAVLNAAAVAANAAQVALDKAAVTAAAGPVIAGMGAFGFPARVQVTNLDTLALSGHFFATGAATGRPAGENSGGYVTSTSDGTANNGSQLFHSISNGKLYKRFRNGGPGNAWGSWEELTTAAAGNDTAFGAESTVASAATTNIGAAATRLILVTGTTTITSLGSGAATTNPHYLLRFAGALTLTHHATDLILPAGKNIITAAGDFALFQYMAAGQWRLISYHKASGEPLFVVGFGAEATIASAATTDLGASGALAHSITGTTTITSLGANATTARAVHRVRFSGVLTLTHNATSLILPNGGNNIVTASGDTAVMQYLGGGNWKCLSYQRVDGKVLSNAQATGAEAKAGVNADKNISPAALAAALQSNSMRYAADTSAGANTIEVALTPAITAYEAGQSFDVKILGTNDGAATININSLGAVSIKRAGQDVRRGDLIDGQIYRFIYDGSFFQLAGVIDRVQRHHIYNSAPLTTPQVWQHLTISRTSQGVYLFSLADPVTSAEEWGFHITLGASADDRTLVAVVKAKSGSTATVHVRHGENALFDPSSMDVQLWVRA